MSVDLKAATPDTTIPATGAFLFGADSQSASAPSVYRIDTTILQYLDSLAHSALAFGASAGAPDVYLQRDAANILAQRNSTSAQALRVYNTYTDASNYERGYVQYVGNVLQIGHEAAGTGAARDVQIKAQTGANLKLYSGQHYFQSAGGSVYGVMDSTGLLVQSGYIKSSHSTGGIGYDTGAGGAVTQATSRTTGVTLNKIAGAITLVSAAGSTTPATFTVTNSAVAATDVVMLCQKSGTDLYDLKVTRVAAGAFDITFNTTGGTTSEQPVINFAVIKAVAA